MEGWGLGGNLVVGKGGVLVMVLEGGLVCILIWC